LGKALSNLGDKYPNELFGIEENGAGVIQTVENGKFSKVEYIFSFPKTKEELDRVKKQSKTREPQNIRWLPLL